MKMPLTYCLLVAAGLVAVGCQRSESIPSAPPQKASPPAAAKPAPALPPGHPDIGMDSQSMPSGFAAEAATPHWTVPAGWQPGRSSPVRRGSFAVNTPDGQSADIAVTVFPGDVGGLLANVNRWRAQIGLTPVTEDQLGGMTTKLEVNGGPATVVDFTNDQPGPGKTQPQRVMVAIMSHDGNSWFFKITGDAPLVAAQKDAYLGFVKSVKF